MFQQPQFPRRIGAVAHAVTSARPLEAVAPSRIATTRSTVIFLLSDHASRIRATSSVVVLASDTAVLSSARNATSIDKNITAESILCGLKCSYIRWWMLACHHARLSVCAMNCPHAQQTNGGSHMQRSCVAGST